jgi:hypothetical protein
MCICAIEKYRNWLMTSDPSTNHRNAFKKHQDGTGLWLLEHSMYKDWKKMENSFMWIHGMCESVSTGIYAGSHITVAGARKTILLCTKQPSH